MKLPLLFASGFHHVSVLAVGFLAGYPRETEINICPERLLSFFY